VRCIEDLQSLHDLPVLAVIAADPQKPRRQMSWVPGRLRSFPTLARA
ncbi:MAG: hypothetical protein JSS35_10880, partial [Proteobacteria bacterium]|nr:hypothetical protein [Pseudomonadota bacterium]